MPASCCESTVQAETRLECRSDRIFCGSAWTRPARSVLVCACRSDDRRNQVNGFRNSGSRTPLRCVAFLAQSAEAFERMGADVMRWQYCAQPPNQKDHRQPNTRNRQNRGARLVGHSDVTDRHESTDGKGTSTAGDVVIRNVDGRSYVITTFEGEQIGSSTNRLDAMRRACEAARRTGGNVWIATDKKPLVLRQVLCP